MKKTLKRMLCICASVSLLAGCGKTAPDATTAEQTTGSEETTLKINDGFPLVDEPVTLHMVVQSIPSHGSFADMPFFQEYEKKTNVHIEWEEIPSAVFEEKKNLLLASGDLPDAFFNRTLTPYDVSIYGPQGYLIPLEGLIEDYTTNLKTVFEKRPEAKAMSTSSDGHIYTLPYIEEMGIIYAQTIMYLNKTWLDNLNLEVPTTTDEYLEVLRAFRDNDPNGNGIKDEIPYSGVYNETQMSFYNMFGAFGRADNVDHMVVENGKAVFTADKEEYKEAIKFFNTMYEEGLMDPEIFTQDSKQMIAKGNSETNIIGSMSVWRDFQIVGKERAAQDYIAIEPLKGPDGTQLWGRENNSEVRPNIFAITSANKYPELTMRWVDGLYDELTSIEMNWGTFGDIQTKNEDGLYVADYTDKTGQGLTPDEVRKHNTPGGDTPCSILSDVYGRLVQMEPGGAGRKEILDQYYAQYIPKESYPVVAFSIEDNERINAIKTDLMSYVKEMTAKWVVKGGIDKDWDNYLEQLKQLNLEEYMEIHQARLDQYLAEQN